ncbi:MAG TPA: hypothetical protein VMJ10_34915 [Kofleriaceae bacterium]|nr:hypothetical protein [Kofleriaceae bacterium]
MRRPASAAWARAGWLTACLAACAGEPPPLHVSAAPLAGCVDPVGARYPWRYRVLPPAELDARKAAFAARNPGEWSLQLNERGLVFHLATTDPSIVAADPDHPDGFSGAELARWSAFLRDNAELFGITDPGSLHLLVVPIAAGPTPNVAELRQYIGPVLRAEVTIGKRPGDKPGIAIDGSLEPIAACPHVDDAALAARLVGRRYVETTAWTRPAERDCGMVPGGSTDACRATPLGTTTAKRTIERANVSVDHELVTVPLGGGWFAERHLACIAVDLPAVEPPQKILHGPEGELASSTVTPTGRAPRLPLAIDVVTGETLDASLCPLSGQALRSP